MFDERLGGANLGGRSVTMFGDAPIIIKSLDIVCAGQIENNKTSRIIYIHFGNGNDLISMCMDSKLCS